jgi:hypothetical protein
MPTTLTFFNVTGDYQCPNDPAGDSTASTPEMDSVQALVTFTARLPKGFTAFVSNYQISANANCQQTVTLIGAITGGTWGLNFNGVWVSPYLAPGATAAQVQTALQAISTIGAGNVTVTGPNGGPYTVTFVGALADAPQTQMLADPSKLTVSSGTPAVSVVMLNPGSTSRVGPAAIALPPRTGRIWTTGQLCSINVADSPNVELASNSAALGLTFPLIYDVTFSQVQLGNVAGGLAPFAFTAPPDTTPFSLTDPASTLLPFQPPIQQSWYPGWTPAAAPSNVTPMRDWRRAG